MITAREALERLREGNHRFTAPDQTRQAETGASHRRALAGGQSPFAVILSCADSRVPPEIVFDQGLGDLFVVRVAGNIVTPPLLGSVEFAVGQLGTRLVVVLGHSSCGAIQAALAQIERPDENLSPNLRSLVDQIHPAVASLLASGSQQDRDALIGQMVRENVRASVSQMSKRSPLIAALIEDDGLVVVGAEYSLESGAVAFFEGVS